MQGEQKVKRASPRPRPNPPVGACRCACVGPLFRLKGGVLAYKKARIWEAHHGRPLSGNRAGSMGWTPRAAGASRRLGMKGQRQERKLVLPSTAVVFRMHSSFRSLIPT
ncbi:hypothetical protein GCG54_00004821 [Colletotrichum gloeosporioides]|uniref:Uncharacterized protein n=1 Tax=Colletotrichum gloeosporioides TaxID=474922 RepID=A0A8H4CGP6_COLGL|nr:uncharacterized protein GCG54_00004821 [Colletotrichum gloeosporioides]KAF3803648.1 hypothetical protein GCG54_00004821 [Colletotrichum gloeosporioides]